MTFKGFVGLVGTFIFALVVIIGLFVFTEKVPEGKVAVVYSPSGGAKEVLNPGWHPIGLFEKTQEYPTRVTIMKNKISVSTNDGKKITMPVSYEMKVDKSKVLKIFKELGSQDVEQIQEGYLYQKLFQGARSTVAKYSVLDIYGTKTTEASATVSELMAESTKDLGFIITNVTLGTPDLDKTTQNAIDARVTAAQQLELKKQELKNEQIEAEKKAVIAKGNADQDVIKAKGEAEAAIEKAKGDAKANELIDQSMTDKVLKKMEMDARKSHGWVTIQGATPLVESK